MLLALMLDGHMFFLNNHFIYKKGGKIENNMLRKVKETKDLFCVIIRTRHTCIFILSYTDVFSNSETIYKIIQMRN